MAKQKKTKRQHQPKQHSKKLGASIAKNIEDALKQPTEEEFKYMQRQCQLVTNMAYSMAESLDNLIFDMQQKCKAINQPLDFEEKYYFGKIQNGVKGIQRIIHKCDWVIADRYCKEADCMSLLHKMLYDRSSSDLTFYKIYLLIKSMPSVMEYDLSEDEDKVTFNHIPEHLRAGIEEEVQGLLTPKDMRKEKKKAVLMLSTEYQRGHSRAGESTMFVDKLVNGEKLHTIRGNYAGWAKKAEQINAGEMELSIRIWSGKPYRSPMYEVAKLTEVKVQSLYATYGVDDAVPVCWVNGKKVEAEVLAKNDGLTLEDWVQWMFNGTNTIENAAIIQLTGFEY